MEATQDKHIEALLKELPKHNAPAGFKQAVMNRITAEQPVTATKAVNAEKWMLAMSLLAAAAAIFFVIDFDFAINGVAGLVQQLGAMLSNKSSFDTFVQTSAQLPSMALMAIMAMATLLLLERILFRPLLGRFCAFLI
jgi:hypothetical protein